MGPCAGWLANDAFLSAQEPLSPEKGDILDHSLTPTGRGRSFKTRGGISRDGPAQLLKAMRLIARAAGFPVRPGPVAYVRPFLERYPAEEARFPPVLKEGGYSLLGGLGRDA